MRRATERERALAMAGVSLLCDERLVPFYAWDFAQCSCDPTHRLDDVPCIVVASRSTGKRGQDIARCVRCGLSWPSPARRRLDRTPAGHAR